jgi:hypothetical protein
MVVAGGKPAKISAKYINGDLPLQGFSAIDVGSGLTNGCLLEKCWEVGSEVGSGLTNGCLLEMEIINLGMLGQ